MFKFLPLLWANLRRKPLRSTLTLASIIIAFLLFGMLQTLRVAMTGSPEMAGADRLMTIHKVSLINTLPQSYLTRIRSVPGVKVACSHNWFGGIYQNDRNQLTVFAVDIGSFFETYPEFELPDEQRRAWLSDRNSIIVGNSVAKRFNWQVGSTIPLRSNIFVKADGSNVWNVKIAGIFTAKTGDNPNIYMHYENFNEARTTERDDIGFVVVRIADKQRATEIARTIDGMFMNSATETKTATERIFAQNFANQLGNIGAIVTAVAGAVFFTMLLVTANTMAESVRERTNELAVMKTLGFSNLGVTGMVVGESLLMTLLGASLGLGMATLVASLLGSLVQQFFPNLGMPSDTFVIGAGIALGLGLLSSILPCTRVWQLKIVDALRKN
jgi:putative ABC transport system permease protein